MSEIGKFSSTKNIEVDILPRGGGGGGGECMHDIRKCTPANNLVTYVGMLPIKLQNVTNGPV